MTLPLTGSLSFTDLNTELAQAPTAQISLDNSSVRTTFGVASGQIALSTGIGKTYTASGFAWGQSIIRDNIRDIIYANSLYVAVGQNNSIVTSASLDGPWTRRITLSNSSSDMIYSVAWSGTRFVAVGQTSSFGGTIWTSTDGLTWTSSAVTYGLFKVKWALNQFIAVGANGQILTSSGGVNWLTRTSNTVETLQSIAFDGTTVVVVGQGGVIRSSTDGTTWTTRSSGSTGFLVDVAWGNSRFLVVTESPRTVLSSTDGATWSTVATGIGNPMQSIIYGSTTFVIGSSNGTIYTTTDGVTLTNRGTTDTNVNSGYHAYINSQYVNFGAFVVFTSSDAITWTRRANIESMYGVAYGASVWVAVGQSPTSGSATVIKSSTDGYTWTSRQSAGGFNNGYNGVIFDTSGNRFVAVGGNGKVSTSTDGTTWTAQTSGTANQLFEISPAAGGYIAVGASGTIITGNSAATTWATRTSGTTNTLYGVAYDPVGGVYIAVGAGGTIRRSTDLATWTASTSGTTNQLNSVAWVMDKFVAVGDGVILTSTNGASGSWTARTGATGHYLTHVINGNTLCVATSGVGTILLSRDGINWTVRETSNRMGLNAVAWNGTKLIAVGTSGVKVESVPPSTSYPIA